MSGDRHSCLSCPALLAASFLVCAAAPAQNDALRRQYLELTESWTREATFTPAEQEAMRRGRQWEQLLTDGLDDPLAKKILAAGEPSFEALAGAYPGKVLDRTLLGTYSDPAAPPSRFDEEFVIWWNGTISANLLPLAAHRTNVVFRVGAKAEMFGSAGERYSRIGYEDGYLPIVRARYRHDGVVYEETALADKTGEWDVAYVRFEMSTESAAPATATLHQDVVLLGEGERKRVSQSFALRAGQSASVYLKIPYQPGTRGPVEVATREEFDGAHRRVRQFWLDLLARGATIETPEERVNRVWRALLLQNFILADGARFTYGSGLRYNDSYYPVENGFGAHTFAMFGFGDYANALAPWAVPVSVRPKLADRKYQNRRGIPFHHLLENYRLTGKTDVFERYREELYRAAEEILSERRRTMTEADGSRPLHWGWLEPDRPAVDLRASTQKVYVPAHNITSCQGLRDFGEFLVRTGIDAERGQRYLAEASEYRKLILEAMERGAIRVPGRPPFVDLQTLYFRQTPDYGPEPYDHLGTGRLQGTYYHYWADMQFRYNFFDPGDAVGQWIADYVAARGGFSLGATRARHRPEQPYGWINNIYNAGYYEYRLRGGRREEFLLGFYSRLAFGMSRHVYVASEGSPFIGYNTRNGGFVSADDSFPNSAANAETLLMLRLMLILEELRENQETGAIYLLRGAPRAWLGDGRRIRVERAPTYFGEMSFSVESSAGRGAIRARIRPPRGAACRALVLALPHPERKPLKRVEVNGIEHRDFDAQQEQIRLACGAGELAVTARYE